MEVVCCKCGNITKVTPDPNTGMPALYEPIGPCPKCGMMMYLGHRLKEAES